MENIKIGKSYLCQPVGLTEVVVGTVLATYMNTAMVIVDEYHPADRIAVGDLQGRALVKYVDFMEEASEIAS